MKTCRHGSLLFACLFGIVSATFVAEGCRPTSEQGISAGGTNGGGEGGSGGNGSGGTGQGGSAAGGESGDEGGSGGAGSGGSETGGSGSGGSESGGSGGGGATGSGGSSESSGGAGGGATPSGNSVTIANGKGSGAMTGYGWVALGSEDMISDPTCGGTEITSASSCAATTWSTKDSLCVSGKIPALPEEPSETDYANNWGIAVGLNASETAAKGLGQDFATVTISVSGSPTAGLRAQVHKAGDPDATTYCLDNPTGALQLTKFSQDCYGAGTKLLAASDIPNIDKVSIQVSSSGSETSVDNLCITGITFGN